MEGLLFFEGGEGRGGVFQAPHFDVRQHICKVSIKLIHVTDGLKGNFFYGDVELVFPNLI